MVRSAALLLVLSACGADQNARMVTSLYTQTCDWSGSDWLGVERMTVGVEYAPQALPPRDLPPGVGNCSTDPRLFLDEVALEGGQQIPNASDNPTWSTTKEDGTLRVESAGLYFDDKSPSGGCLKPDEIAGDGVVLNQAGVLDGAQSPPPSIPGMVFLDGQRDGEWDKTLQFGQPIDLSWTAEGWDESFVQIRQANGGTIREVLTCNTTGMTTFTIDNAVWAQTTNLGAQTLELVVAQRNTGTTSGKGEDLEAITQLVQVIPQD